MKNWCKILKVGKHDVLVQRLVTKEDGEHVKITVRFDDGQFIKSACMGDGDDAEKQAIELFKEYGKESAKLFVKELERLNEDNEKKDNNQES